MDSFSENTEQSSRFREVSPSGFKVPLLYGILSDSGANLSGMFLCILMVIFVAFLTTGLLPAFGQLGTIVKVQQSLLPGSLIRLM